MSFREFKIAEQMLPPRESHIIREEIEQIVSEGAYPHLWTLIKELEEGAWQGGASEGYDHGYQDADYKHTGE